MGFPLPRLCSAPPYLWQMPPSFVPPLQSDEEESEEEEDGRERGSGEESGSEEESSEDEQVAGEHGLLPAIFPAIFLGCWVPLPLQTGTVPRQSLCNSSSCLCPLCCCCPSLHLQAFSAHPFIHILPLSFHTIHPIHPSPASLGPAEARQAIQDQTQTNLVNLRRTIYLTIMSALDFEEAGHKLLKMVGGLQGVARAEGRAAEREVEVRLPVCVLSLPVVASQQEALCPLPAVS